jgi:hypothetical protein
MAPAGGGGNGSWQGAPPQGNFEDYSAPGGGGGGLPVPDFAPSQAPGDAYVHPGSMPQDQQDWGGVDEGDMGEDDELVDEDNMPDYVPDFEDGQARPSQGHAGGHGSASLASLTHASYTANFIGCLELPTDNDEAERFVERGTKNGTIVGDHINFTLGNGLMIASEHSDPEAVALLRDKEAYITECVFTEIVNTTGQIFDPEIMTGTTNSNGNSLFDHIVVQPNRHYRDLKVYAAPFDQTVADNVRSFGVTRVSQITDRITLKKDLAILEKSGADDQVANLVSRLFRSMTGSLPAGTEETLTLDRKSYMGVLEYFKLCVGSISLPVAAADFGVKMHRMRIDEHADTSPAARWYSKTGSHGNSISFQLRITIAKTD